MRNQNLIHDEVLKYYLLDRIRDGGEYQFSDFLPLFLRHWPYEFENRDSFPVRIRLSLFEMEDKGWVEIESWSQQPVEILTFTGDFKFWITPSGVEALIEPETTTRQKSKRRQSQPTAPSIAMIVPKLSNRHPQNEHTEKEQAKAIVTRRGQQEFRQDLLNTYKKCLVTGCDAEEVLEAAHIRPYSEGGSFELSNGLLLRADIHTLFDLRLIAVDTRQMTVIVSSALAETTYGELDGQSLHFPRGTYNIPDKQALDEHRKEANL